MDTKTNVERSRNMAAIRSANTQPELMLRRTLWRLGLRFFTTPGWQRLTGTKLPGSPDLILPSGRLIIFVDGCFWHGCPEHYHAPADNREYWSAKLLRNKERDQQVTAELQQLGWHVLRFWEHELRKGGREAVAETVRAAIAKEPPTL